MRSPTARLWLGLGCIAVAAVAIVDWFWIQWLYSLPVLGYSPWLQWVALAVLAIGVFLTVSAMRSRRTEVSPQVIDGAVIQGTPPEASQKLQLSLAGIRNTAVTQAVDGTVWIHRTYYPGWTIVVAVLFFPLGLLALLARRTKTGSVVLAQDGPDGRLKVHARGEFNRRTIDALLSFVDSCQSKTIS